MDFQKSFEKFNSEFPGSAEKTKQLRVTSSSFFKEHGLPSRKNENWKYTGLKTLTENNFFTQKANVSLSSELSTKIESRRSPEFYDFVFLNGSYLKNLSSTSVKGFSVESKAPSRDFDGHSDWGGDEHLHSLNGMFSQEEIEIKIEKGAVLDKPLRLLFLNDLAGGPSLMTYPRVSLQIESGAQATLIESHQALETSRYFVNSLLRVNIKKQAQLKYIFHQNQSETAIHLGQSLLRLSADSRLQALSFHAGATLSRHNVEAHFTESGAEVDLLGLAVMAGRQHCDNKTLIRHEVGHCTSRQLYKSILSDEARYIFSGKIKIALNAQKASSEQLNKNLLLSSKAEVDSEPQLEVEADDVKATHGSTVGQLSADELFYFKSRGISEKKALDLLSFGFAADIVDHIEGDVVRSFLNQELQKAFVKLAPDALKKPIHLESL